MYQSIQEFFRQLAETHPKWNFVYIYDPVQAARVRRWNSFGRRV